MGLEGVGMLREPTVLVLGLRIDSLSSLSPAPSPTPLGLLLGCVDPGTAGPPGKRERSRRQNNLIMLTPEDEANLCNLPYRSQSAVSGDGMWRHCAAPCGQRRRRKVHQRRRRKWSVCWFRC